MTASVENKFKNGVLLIGSEVIPSEARHLDILRKVGRGGEKSRLSALRQRNVYGWKRQKECGHDDGDELVSDAAWQDCDEGLRQYVMRSAKVFHISITSCMVALGGRAAKSCVAWITAPRM